ncbi:MAG: hypothetical protein ACXAD7_14150 [Candidatus Kariarchaeaceae archaeon]|jgi:predicted HicB family RNase H-like nuclease
MTRKTLLEKRERNTHVRLTDELHKSLNIEVALNGKTIQDWVTESIEMRLSKKE